MDERYFILFGEEHTFGEQEWTRYSEGDGGNWRELNDAWEGRAISWYMPLDWVNYEEARLFTKDADLWYRYSVLLYQALLNLGQNEFGPVNVMEFFYFLFTLIVSAMLSALLFGDIANLI